MNHQKELKDVTARDLADAYVLSGRVRFVQPKCGDGLEILAEETPETPKFIRVSMLPRDIIPFHTTPGEKIYLPDGNGFIKVFIWTSNDHLNILDMKGGQTIVIPTDCPHAVICYTAIGERASFVVRIEKGTEVSVFEKDTPELLRNNH